MAGTKNKTNMIIKSKTITEKIIFRGEKMTIEKVEKEWNIPEIITEDIGFQLMFGFKPPTMNTPTKSKGLQEYFLDNRY